MRLVALLPLVLACGTSDGTTDGGTEPDTAIAPDAWLVPDGETSPDAAVIVNGAAPDCATDADAATSPDAATSSDAATAPDAGPSPVFSTQPADYASIRSAVISHYNVTSGNACDVVYPNDLNLFKRDAALVKTAGFNTVWIPLSWKDHNPVALPTASYDEAHFTRLQDKLAFLDANGMRAILPLNYVNGCSEPEGISVVSWSIGQPEQYAAFEVYVRELASRIVTWGYADIVYLMVFPEGTELPDDYVVPPTGIPGVPSSFNGTSIRDGVSCYGSMLSPDGNGNNVGYQLTYSACFRALYAETLRDTLGSLPLRMGQSDPDLRRAIRWGLHDYALINLNWGQGQYPILDDNNFDFLSMVFYPEYGGIGWNPSVELPRWRTDPSGYESAIAQEASARRAFLARYGKPLILGETGRSTCYLYPNDNLDQAAFDVAAAEWAESQGMGISIWAGAWIGTGINPSTGRPYSCNPGLGYAVTTPQGDVRQALLALSQLWGGTLQGCKHRPFLGGSIAPQQIAAGNPYEVRCDYGAVVGTIVLAGSLPGTCGFTTWEGTTAVFTCTGATAPGTYEGSCHLLADASFCERVDPVGTLTVN